MKEMWIDFQLWWGLLSPESREQVLMSFGIAIFAVFIIGLLSVITVANSAEPLITCVWKERIDPDTNVYVCDVSYFKIVCERSKELGSVEGDLLHLLGQECTPQQPHDGGQPQTSSE